MSEIVISNEQIKERIKFYTEAAKVISTVYIALIISIITTVLSGNFDNTRKVLFGIGFTILIFFSLIIIYLVSKILTLLKEIK